MVKLALNMTWTIKNDSEDLEKLHRILQSEDLDEQGLTWLKENHSKRLEDKLHKHFEIDYIKSKLKRNTFVDTLISGEITSRIFSCYQEDSDTEELKVKQQSELI